MPILNASVRPGGSSACSFRLEVLVGPAWASSLTGLPPVWPVSALACGGIPWTAADWELHVTPYPAVRLVQDYSANDTTADGADFETGTMPLPMLVRWAKEALVNYKNAVRPGQRSPAIYCQRSNVSVVVNALIAGGITSGIGLGIAQWNNDRAQALHEVANGGGPWPVVFRQYASFNAYDANVVSVPWLTTVSKKPISASADNPETPITMSARMNRMTAIARATAAISGPQRPGLWACS